MRVHHRAGTAVARTPPGHRVCLRGWSMDAPCGVGVYALGRNTDGPADREGNEEDSPLRV